ncbi:thioredoxin family protein [Candidatus Peregrinibacteria bacterium]|nr:thioredoxin family protein [Candidatus Peregrinibacteria bacterium]
MVLLKSESIPMGTDAPNFSLEGTDGKIYSLRNFMDAKVLVIVFMCNHCPYVQTIWPNLIELSRDFADNGVQFVGINPNTINPEYEEESMEMMQRYFNEQGMNFPYLEDKKQSVAREYGASCTPDIFVYDAGRKLAYHGRIDNNELADAIDALLVDGQPDDEQNPSQGCSIKWV